MPFFESSEKVLRKTAAQDAWSLLSDTTHHFHARMFFCRLVLEEEKGRSFI
jgi:hypothetical protein